MSRNSTPSTIATIGVDIGKNTFHLVALDRRGAIVLQLKVSRGQLERRLANVPCCLIGMEACSGAHHLGRRLEALGHDVRLIPAQYVKPFLKGHKNDYRDAEAIADPWGNRIEIVGYGNIQFTKAPNVLRGMGLAHLSKNEKAIKELTDKGMAPN